MNNVPYYPHLLTLAFLIRASEYEEKGILGCNALYFGDTDVSKENIAPIFRIKD
jgi:hypothetical protein